MNEHPRTRKTHSSCSSKGEGETLKRGAGGVEGMSARAEGGRAAPAATPEATCNCDGQSHALPAPHEELAFLSHCDSETSTLIKGLQLCPEVVLDAIRRRKGAAPGGTSDAQHVPACAQPGSSRPDLQSQYISSAVVLQPRTAEQRSVHEHRPSEAEQHSVLEHQPSAYNFGGHIREPLWQTSTYQDVRFRNEACSRPEHARTTASATPQRPPRCEATGNNCEADYSKAVTHEQKRPRNSSLAKVKITPTALEPEFNSSVADPGRGVGAKGIALCLCAVLVPLLLFSMQHQYLPICTRVLLPRQDAPSVDMRRMPTEGASDGASQDAPPVFRDSARASHEYVSIVEHQLAHTMLLGPMRDAEAGGASRTTDRNDVRESPPAVPAAGDSNTSQGQRLDGVGMREANGAGAVQTRGNEARLWVGMTVGSSLHLVRQVVRSRWVLCPLSCLGVLFLDFLFFA